MCESDDTIQVEMAEAVLTGPVVAVMVALRCRGPGP
jgi:hypothetical protein